MDTNGQISRSMTVVNFVAVGSTSLLGYVDLQLASGMVLRECGYFVNRADSKEWVNLPQWWEMDRDGNRSNFRDLVGFAGGELYWEFQEQAKEAIHRFLKETGYGF